METSAVPLGFTILGAGAAGLSAGYFARKAGAAIDIFEAGATVGGSAVTYRHGDFLYDSGAHRWHDRDPEMTAEVLGLLGRQLKKIFVPSRILQRGRFVDFPLSPFNLLLALGVRHFSRATIEVIAARCKGGGDAATFENFALKTYGRTIAERFLLNYSEKLWGAPCNALSPNIAGRRMKGLNLQTFVKEAFCGSRAKTEHLDGSFYYPDTGIGAITGGLADACGRPSIRTGAKVTRIFHTGDRIAAIEINGTERIAAQCLINTLPLNRFVRMLEPAPPPEILCLADALRFRHMILVALFLDREPVTRAATIYFPEPEYAFTRLYEPVNRSPSMAPPGKTSLVVEMPAQQDGPEWTADDERLIGRVKDCFVRLGWIESRQVLGGEVRRISNAYPILEFGFEEKCEAIHGYLRTFKNLACSGRGGRFQYIHLHDMMRLGKRIVEGFAAGA